MRWASDRYLLAVNLYLAVLAIVGVLVGASCGATQPAQVAEPELPAIGRLTDGTSVRIEIAGERIARLVPTTETATWLWPGLIDSHVHLAYWPVADELATAGIAGVVDLAAPERTLGAANPLHVLASGPMLTRVDGYPLTSWGSDGYGTGCADAACVMKTIDRLAVANAGVVKIALDRDGLDPALVPAAVTAAHAKGHKVCVHALSDASVRLAAEAGADVLAHTPVEPLTPETIEAWASVPGRAVISTLAAFGGSPTAVANLRALRAAGVTVLYGTDLGNLRDAGPSRSELALLAEAGLSDADITAAMTTAPAAYWGMPIGPLAEGSEATFVALERDPRTDATALLSPRAAWLRGRRVR
jgi:imidazolonepropionase-like amidohydrolase